MQTYVLFFSIILISYIFARRYNFLHGIFTLFGLTSLVLLFVELTKGISALSSFYESFTPMVDLLSLFFTISITDFLAEASLDLDVKVIYGLFIGLFIVWHIISSKMRAKRTKKAVYVKGNQF